VVVDHDQIQFPGFQSRDQPVQMIVNDRQLHIGAQAPESRKRRRHERAQYRRKGAEAQPAAPSPADLGDFLFGRFQSSENAFCVPGQSRTDFGEFDRSATTLQHRRADLFLQGGDMLTDGRLGHPHHARRGGETSLLGDQE
jgi:hypothetical protein